MILPSTFVVDFVVRSTQIVVALRLSEMDFPLRLMDDEKIMCASTGIREHIDVVAFPSSDPYFRIECDPNQKHI